MKNHEAMAFRYPRRSRRILFRIFFTFLLTAVVIIGGIGWLAHSLGPERSLSPVIEKNVAFYLSSLQQKLTQSLSQDGIQNLEQELQLQVRVDGFDNLAEQQGLPTFSEIEKEDKHYSPSIAVGHAKGFMYVGLKGTSPRAVWFIADREFPRNMAFPFIGIAGFTLVILVLSFLTIRWMMSPVKSVLVGVNKISAGNLSFRIHTSHRGGEFGIIGEAFNRMADNLEKMIFAKEKLLRDVSHELRSPLTRAGVAVDLIDDEKIKTSIKEDLRKMDEMISEILESYRLREHAHLKLAPADLSELIENTLENYQNTPPGVKFKPFVGSAIYVLDVMQMERALRNFIENAIKYSDKSSRPIEVSLEKSAEDWLITVRDDGTGIAEKDLPHIFEPFFRADAARTPGKSGFGLGLSIAKSIIEAHEGTIDVESQPGEGASFRIRLPINKYDR